MSDEYNLKNDRDALKCDSVTFGKYKDGTLSEMLRDRKYCSWLVKQEWFREQYEYLYNRVVKSNPSRIFYANGVSPKGVGPNGTSPIDLPFLALVHPNEITCLSPEEDKCYAFYYVATQELLYRVENNKKDNKYDIKAPTSWLKVFEKTTGLKRDVFKEFLSAYELPNITSLVEMIKEKGGIKYKGGKSYIIAKNNSVTQEKYWEKILKEKYNEDISIQFKYGNCFFDFLNIGLGIIYECKLKLKDFNEEQYEKYKKALKRFNLVYLIDTDCVIDVSNKILYTNNIDKYNIHLQAVKCGIYKNPNFLEKELLNFSIQEIKDLADVL